MDLVRSWLGQALRASGAAVVVPVAILAALSLTAIGGSGIAGLGALSQIVSGPSAAGSDTVVPDGEAEIGDAVTQLAAADVEAGAAPAEPSVPAPGDAPGGPDGGGPGPVGLVPPPAPDGGEAPDGSAPPAPPPGGGGGGGENPPAQDPPGLVEGVGQGVEQLTEGTPLAPTVEDAVGTLLEVCGRLGCP